MIAMSYTDGFAEIYDRIIQSQVDFSGYAEFFADICKYYGVQPKSVLDIACGSGIFTERLQKYADNITAFDISEEMLSIASSRLGDKCRLIAADMTDFDLSERFDAAVCTLDGLNHLCDIKSLNSAFRCISRHLKAGSVFMFDVNTVYKHRNVLCSNTFVFDEEDYYLVWQNFLKRDTVSMQLDCFVSDGAGYKRFSDDVTERAYNDDVITARLLANGFNKIRRFDFGNFGRIRPHSEKIIYTAIKV